jgi:hypothetical protein
MTSTSKASADRGLLRGLHDAVEPLRLREVADLPQSE